jgi:hypothetical protein
VTKPSGMPIPPLPLEEMVWNLTWEGVELSPFAYWLSDFLDSTPREGCSACRKRLRRVSTHAARRERHHPNTLVKKTTGGSLVDVLSRRLARCARSCCPTSHRFQMQVKPHGRVGPGLDIEAIPALQYVHSLAMPFALPGCTRGREESQALKSAESTMSIYQKTN